ncbi:unnamed protein product [Aphanomyces euteiches]
MYQHGPFADPQRRPSIAVASMGVSSPTRMHNHVNPPEIPLPVDETDDDQENETRGDVPMAAPMAQRLQAVTSAPTLQHTIVRQLKRKMFLCELTNNTACVSDVRRRTIAKFELREPADQISEQEWRDYFYKANEIGIIEYSRVDRAMKSLRLNTSLTDAPSHVAKLVHQLTIQLGQLSVESFLETEQKGVVGYLVAALAPPTFKATVCDELGRQQNKP